jgi:pyridoxamine 5'-phosphate oxidase
MTANDTLFEGEDPILIARRWLAEAEETEPNDANAMALSTVDADGMPNVRIVLLKGVEKDGFVFYTNYGSAKANELAQNQKAAFVLHWKSLRRQVRVRGAVTREDGEIADRYFATRPKESRIGAWASRQSQPLESRAALQSEIERLTESLGDDPKRPEFWGGYRIKPSEIELWADGPFRLHDRFRYTRNKVDTGWVRTRLNP